MKTRKRSSSLTKPTPPVTTTAASPNQRRRRSSRGQQGALSELAKRIVDGDKVVFITGAGLSVASGIRPFRTRGGGDGDEKLSAIPSSGSTSSSGIWNDVIWTTATRESFRKNPVRWYNEFWIPFFHTGPHYPNSGHYALQEMLKTYQNVFQITQNIDGLQPPSDRLIEAHGRVHLYKCLAEEDSDTDDDSDDEDDRRVHLGHRRKSAATISAQKLPTTCPYQYLQSLTPDQLEPASARQALHQPFSQQTLTEAPTCPVCHSTVMPQALLFDEGYHAHSFYEFTKAEAWLDHADVLVFCGTSFSVRITTVALQHAREQGLAVYNLNTRDWLESTARLNVSNIMGSTADLLPKLVQECRAYAISKDQVSRVSDEDENEEEGAEVEEEVPMACTVRA